jgi:hypothetical protein
MVGAVKPMGRLLVPHSPFNDPALLLKFHPTDISEIVDQLKRRAAWKA